MKKVYLAGAIFGQSDSACRDWRKATTEQLASWGHEALDPMRRDYRGKEQESKNDIIRFDLIDIATCDVLFVYAATPSWGTAMELVYARILNKHVIVWGVPRKFSPWLEFHADAYAYTLEEGWKLLATALANNTNTQP